MIAGGTASVVIACGLMLAACSSSSPSVGQPTTSSTSTTTAPDAVYGTGAAVCRSGDLRLTLGFGVSAASGHNPLSFTLLNTGASPCTLDGYPTVALLDAQGGALPFVYTHAGNIMVTASAPQSVFLTPGHVAWFLIDKYRCDLGIKTTIGGMSFTLPGVTSALTLAAPAEPLLGYCGAGDPGSVVAVSPVEPTLQLTQASH